MRPRAIAFAIAVAAVLTGCAAPAAGPAAPTGVQSCGRDVTFDSPPRSVLALGAEAPALLVAAGAGDRLTHYAGSLDIPFGEAAPFVERAEHLGVQRDLSVEAIIGTGVDVVISSSSISSAAEIDSFAGRLEQAGIALLIVSGYCSTLGDTSLDDLSGYDVVYRDLETYGRVFGTEQVAAGAVAGLRERVSAVEAGAGTTVAGTTAAALYVVDDGPLGGYGNQALVADQMTSLALVNVFDLPERYFEPNAEQILDSDPGVVIALYIPDEEGSTLASAEDVTEELRSRPEFATVVDGARVLALDYYYTSPSPLAVDGLELLADQLSGA